MKLNFNRQRRTSRGFTLLEIILAVFLISILVTGIMFIAHTANKVSQSVMDEQNETIREQAFFAMMRRHFDNLPGNAITELSLRGDEGFEMTFEETPFSFQIGATPVAAESMTLIASGQLGDMNMDLMFYENRILVDSAIDESTDGSGVSDEPIAVLPLLEGLWFCECEVFSQTELTDRFEGRDPAEIANYNEWYNREELPVMVTLRIQYEKGSDLIEQKYWLRNKVDIGSIIQQFSNQRGGGQAGDSDSPEIQPTIPADPADSAGAPASPTLPQEGAGQ